MAVVPATVASATTHHPKHHKRHTATSPTSSGSGAATVGCTDLATEQTKESQLTSQLEQAMVSGNFAAVKQALTADFSQLNGFISAAQAHLASAPANVRAAFNTEASAFKSLETDIEGATSITGLASSFESLGTNPQIKSAGETLAAYYGSKCGSTATTTSVAG